MSTTYLDPYGRSRSARTDSPVDAPMPYQVVSNTQTDQSTGHTVVTRYTRFRADTDKVAIWKETLETDENGNQLSFTREFAYARWVDRESEDVLWVPINQCWDYPH